MDIYHLKYWGIKDLGMIQFLFQIILKLTFGQISPQKKMKIDHRSIAFKKLKRKLKLYKFFI